MIRSEGGHIYRSYGCLEAEKAKAFPNDEEAASSRPNRSLMMSYKSSLRAPPLPCDRAQVLDTNLLAQLSCSRTTLDTLTEMVKEGVDTTLSEFQHFRRLTHERLLARKQLLDETILELQERLRVMLSSAQAMAAEVDDDAEAVDAQRQQMERDRSIFAFDVKMERAELAEVAAVVGSVNKMQSKRVKLNIGGKRYDISSEALTREKGSLFERMVTGHHDVEMDESGCIVINRDGSCYEFIFNFLRDGERAALPTDAGLRRQLQIEAEFLSLPSLMRCLSLSPSSSITRRAPGGTDKLSRVSVQRSSSPCTPRVAPPPAPSAPRNSNLHSGPPLLSRDCAAPAFAHKSTAKPTPPPTFYSASKRPSRPVAPAPDVSPQDFEEPSKTAMVKWKHWQIHGDATMQNGAQR